MVSSNDLEMVTTRQLAQQARRDQEYRHGQIIAPQTNRALAQRVRRIRERPLRQQRPSNIQVILSTRRNRECPLMQQLLPIGRRPLLPELTGTLSVRHQLGRCDASCVFCGAEHWLEERVQGSSNNVPKFSTCCQSSTIVMDRFDNPPHPLYSLLMDLTPCIFPDHMFTNNERPYNFVKIYAIITMPLHSVPSA